MTARTEAELRRIDHAATSGSTMLLTVALICFGRQVEGAETWVPSLAGASVLLAAACLYWIGFLAWPRGR